MCVVSHGGARNPSPHTHTYGIWIWRRWRWRVQTATWKSERGLKKTVAASAARQIFKAQIPVQSGSTEYVFTFFYLFFFLIDSTPFVVTSWPRVRVRAHQLILRTHLHWIESNAAYETYKNRGIGIEIELEIVFHTGIPKDNPGYWVDCY